MDFYLLVALKRAVGLVFCNQTASDGLLGAGVLGDGLGALRDSMFGELTGRTRRTVMSTTQPSSCRRFWASKCRGL